MCPSNHLFSLLFHSNYSNFSNLNKKSIFHTRYNTPTKLDSTRSENQARDRMSTSTDEKTEKTEKKDASDSRTNWKGNKLYKFERDMVAGAVMGGAVHTVVAPIERVKLLLQTQEGNAALLSTSASGPHRQRFKGFIDCIVRTVRDEGFISLWRGNGTGVLRYYPSVALNFSLKDLYRAILKGNESSTSLIPNKLSSIAATNFLAGASAGCTTLVIIYPLDIAHTRLAADIGHNGSRQFKGISDFLRTIYRKNGIRGIYEGLPASLHGMIIHRGLYFGGFDTLKDTVIEEESPLWKRWVAAQVVTSSAGLVSYPLDTVRRRMMMQSGLETPVYSGTLDCWRKIYRKEGVRSFYRGAMSNMLRSTGAAAILVLYDEVKKFMNWGGL